MSEEKKHYRLSPSAAHRWLKCPGEPAMREASEKTTSSYAEEGTTAHWVGEECLRWDHPASKLVGKICPETKMVVTAEMAECVQIYIDECRRVMGDNYHRIEEKVLLDDVSTDCGGTVDFFSVVEKRTLMVRDYKHGKGVPVSPAENPQLNIYALGALGRYSMQRPGSGPGIHSIVVGIVQPRADEDEPVKLVALLTTELIAWKEETLKPAVERVRLADEGQLSEDERLVAGDHCKFCPAKATCPAQYKRNIAAAKIDFATVGTVQPPAPETIPMAKLVQVLAVKEQVEGWLSSIEAFALRELEAGKSVPGFKLVKKKSNRAWKDNTVAADALKKVLGSGAYKAPVLISPAEAEKQLKVFGVALSGELVIKPDTGNTIAPASDKRPAVNLLPASADFLQHADFLQ